MELTPVFVYGTLRMGEYNHHLIEAHGGRMELGARLAGHALWCRMDYGFPYMDVDEACTVVGELVHWPELSAEAGLRALDWLEGFTEGMSDNHYDRVLVSVEDSHGVAVEAWTYRLPGRVAGTLPGRGFYRLDTGDWLTLGD